MADISTALVPPTVEPSLERLPVHKFLSAFIRNPLSTFPKPIYEEPYFVLRNGGRTTVYVCDPPLIERFLLEEAAETPKSPLEKRVLGDTLGDGILTAQGASWRWQRRTAAPLFRPADIAALVPQMSREAEAQIERWRQSASAMPGGAVQRIDHDMTEATFRVISATMFGGAADAEGRLIQDNADTMLRWVSWEIGYAIVGLPWWVPHPGKLPRLLASRRMRAAVHGILARRRKSEAGGDDLMGRLMAAKDPDSGRPMDDEQIVDNMLTFLAAGHETTAKALTWALYLLGRSPEWQERIRAEVRQVVGDATVTSQHLERLVITRQVVKEAMRLYPPAAIMSRVVTKPTAIGDTTIPAGSILVFPIYAIHRHRKLWREPDMFDPTRFAPEAEKALHRAQFMPFGFGPRLCIGMAFAMMEAQTFLATLVRGARFTWDGEHVPIPVSRVTLRAKGGMPLVVETLD